MHSPPVHPVVPTWCQPGVDCHGGLERHFWGSWEGWEPQEEGRCTLLTAVLPVDNCHLGWPLCARVRDDQARGCVVQSGVTDGAVQAVKAHGLCH
jgi:hypothetical protein